MAGTTLGIDVRSRVLERIRRALAEGDEAGAMRIARELARRFDASRAGAAGGELGEPALGPGRATARTC